MIQKHCILFYFVLNGVHLVTTEESSIKNIMCKDIKNVDGYKFSTEPENKSKTVFEIDILQKNKTETVNIAFWKDEKCNASSEVVNCDNNSITTRTCSSIHMKFIYKDKGGKISESWLIYNITEDLGADPDTGLNCSTDCILCIFFSVILFVVLSGILIDVMFWQKKQKEKGRGGYRFVDYLHQRKKQCPCNNNNGNSNRQVEQSVEDNRRNCLQEQDQQQQLLGGKSDNTESNGGIADFYLLDEMKNDAKGVPQVSEVLPQKNGNMGHDPGGGKEDTKRHCNGNSTLEPSFNSDMDNGRLSTHKQGNGNPTLQPSLICDMDNRCLSTHKQGSAEKEATDETAGDKCLTLVDSLGPGINSNEPPDGDEDAHHKA